MLKKIKTFYVLVLLIRFSATEFSMASPLLTADEVEAFKAGGYLLTGTAWHTECNDPAEASFAPAIIESRADLNGDGLPELVISEGGTLCYGNTGSGFTIVSKQPDKTWKLMFSSTGIPIFLKNRGLNGWPDIQIGGPGFCFQVQRWNGESYAFSRYEYEGKSCKIR